MAMPMNMTYGQMFTMLKLISQYTAYTLLPTSCFLIFLGVVGVVGNTISIYIFVARMKRNLQNDLLTFLTSLSQISICLSLPRELTEIFFAYMYPDLMLCKIGRFSNTFANSGQVFTLIALAVVRYRAVCKGRPVQVRSAFIIVGLVLASISVSWIAPMMFGFRTTPTIVKGILGRECSLADGAENTIWPILYNIFSFMGFFALVVVTAFCYIRIWATVRDSNKAMTAHVRRDNSDNGNAVPKNGHNQNLSKEEMSKSRTPSSASKTDSKPASKTIDKRKSVEIAITFTAFLLTFTFILSYTPFFVISIPRFWIPDFDYSDDLIISNVIKIFIRFYFISPSLNPFIFLVSNLEFKRQFVNMLSCSKKE